MFVRRNNTKEKYNYTKPGVERGTHMLLSIRKMIQRQRLLKLELPMKTILYCSLITIIIFIFFIHL